MQPWSFCSCVLLQLACEYTRTFVHSTSHAVSVFHTWTSLLTLTSDLSHFHRHVYCIHYLILLSVQLFDLIYREETLLNVIKSVTRNGRSIVLTAVLALILVYLFSIVGYIIFKDDFILTVDRISNKTLGENNRWISLWCCPKLCLKMKLWKHMAVQNVHEKSLVSCYISNYKHLTNYFTKHVRVVTIKSKERTKKWYYAYRNLRVFYGPTWFFVLWHYFHEINVIILLNLIIAMQ